MFQRYKVKLAVLIVFMSKNLDMVIIVLTSNN